MLNIKNGKLKINTDRTPLELMLDISYVALFVVVSAFGSVQRGENYIYYVCFFAVVGLTVLLRVLGRQTITVKLPTFWYGAFILYAMFSSVWAMYSVNYSTHYFLRMIQAFTVGFCVLLYVRCYEDLERFLTIVILSFDIMVATIFARTPVDKWFAGFLGSGVTRENISIVAYTCVMAICFAFYKANYLGQRIHYLSVALIFSYVLFSSSRKAIIMAALIIVCMILFFVGRRGYVIKLAAILAVVAAVAVAMFSIPELYDAVGFRFEKMFSVFLTGTTESDGSISLRLSFFETAYKMFLKHPIFGIGLGNINMALHLATGKGSYSHNNYIEIASCLGIVGIIVYYWYYIYILIKLSKKAYRGDKLCVALFFLLLTVMVGEISQVDFYSIVVQVMLVICFCAVNYEPKNNESNYY